MNDIMESILELNYKLTLLSNEMKEVSARLDILERYIDRLEGTK